MGLEQTERTATVSMIHPLPTTTSKSGFDIFHACLGWKKSTNRLLVPSPAPRHLLSNIVVCRATMAIDFGTQSMGSSLDLHNNVPCYTIEVVST